MSSPSHEQSDTPFGADAVRSGNVALVSLDRLKAIHHVAEVMRWIVKHLLKQEESTTPASNYHQACRELQGQCSTATIELNALTKMHQYKKRPSPTGGSMFEAGGVWNEAVTLLPTTFAKVIALTPVAKSYDTSPDDGLCRALRHGWRRASRPSASKDDLNTFVRSCLTFSSENNKDNTAIALDFCASLQTLNTKWPETNIWQLQFPRQASEARDIGYVPLTICHAARAVYDALSPDTFGVRIRLTTDHRVGNLTPKSGSIEHGINMYFSSTDEDAWQEIDVYYRHPSEEGESPSKRLKTTQDSQDSQPSDGSGQLKGPQPVRHSDVCVERFKFKRNNLTSFHYLVREASLFFESSLEGSDININIPPVSLRDLLEQNQWKPFWDNLNKCMLAVLVSYAVLNLYDTPWLPETWGSENIVFHYDMSVPHPKLPFTPYLKLRIPGIPEASHDNNVSAEPRKDIVTQQVPGDHPCPHLTTLAKLLLEILYSRPFSSIAETYLPNYDASESDPSSRHIYINKVFKNICKEQRTLDIMGSAFRRVIETCLASGKWEETSETSERIYRDVVRPLEGVLEQEPDAASDRNLPSCAWLDGMTKKIDCSFWRLNNKPATDRERGSRDQTLPSNLRLRAPSASRPTSTDHSVDSSIQHHGLLSPTSEPEAGPDTEQLSDTRFYDDEMHINDHNLKARAYCKWKEGFQKVYEKFVGDPKIRGSHLSSPVKIAVLDTGIDLRHGDIKASREQIKEMRSWVTKEPEDAADRGGHGTFVTALLLEYAPDAEIYVARIACKEDPEKPQVIAKAIKHAVEVWKVDIINMSFGYNTNEMEGYGTLLDEIEAAHKEDVLLFAAASNNCGQSGQTWPAREYHVICVHSTDTHGNRSPFCPLALPTRSNLSTVGEAVESAWPRNLCVSQNQSTYTSVRSGTSYSTPILAAMAAFLLMYVRMNQPDIAKRFKKKHLMEGLLRMSASMQDPMEGFYFIDIRLGPGTLFAVSEEERRKKIKKAALGSH